MNNKETFLPLIFPRMYQNRVLNVFLIARVLNSRVGDVVTFLQQISSNELCLQSLRCTDQDLVNSARVFCC
jgi:hypothetical protein